MKALLTATLVVLQAMSFFAYAEPSKHNPDISLEDYLKIEGLYEMKFQSDAKAYVFVLMYDAKKNQFVGSIANKVLNHPLITFHDLKTELSPDRKKILCSGFDTSTHYAELKIEIDLEQRIMIGELVTGGLVETRQFRGAQTVALFNSFDFRPHNRVKEEDLAGVYVDEKKGIRLLVRQFSNKVLTASLTIRGNQLLPLVGGTYSEKYGLLEFTSESPSTRARLRTKMDIQVQPNGTAKVFIYGTTGVKLNYSLRKTGTVL